MESFRNITGVEHIIVNRAGGDGELKTTATAGLIQQPIYKVQQVHIPPHVIITKKQDQPTFLVDRGSSSTSNSFQHVNNTVPSNTIKRKSTELSRKPKKRRYPKKRLSEDRDYDAGRAKIDVAPLPAQENRVTSDYMPDETVDLDEEKLPFGLSQNKDVVERIRERKDEEMEYKIVYAPRGTTRSGRQSKPRRMFEEVEEEPPPRKPSKKSKKAAAKKPDSAIEDKLSSLEPQLQNVPDSFSQYLMEQKTISKD